MTRQTSPHQTGEISPDDLLIVQKRQDWRLRVARICLELFEMAEADLYENAQHGSEQVEALTAKYRRIADFVKRDLNHLLVSGVTVNELEAVRYQVNYFLEEVIRFVRNSVQNRAQTKSPLDSLEHEALETEVIRCLRQSPDALLLFIDDLIRLAELEIEADHQRQRIRLLLGGDRKLSQLGNNEAIMTAPLDQLWRVIGHFFDTSEYLRENLPPLLETESPYPELESELRLANEQLQNLAEIRIAPFEEKHAAMKYQDAALQELDLRLREADRTCGELLEVRVLPLGRQASRGSPPALKEIRKLGEVLDELAESLRGIGRDGLAVASEEGTEEGPFRVLSAKLEELGEVAAGLADNELSVVSSASSDLLDRLRDAQARLRSAASSLAEAQRILETLRTDRVRSLREEFCTLTGEFRTFLQTGFAHIAAKDPRSTESSYHFFLREFSNEAHQAILLLKEIRELEVFIGGLQQMKVAGLPLTPENLARILRVLFVDKDNEKKRIPSGEGWKVLSIFLEKLKNDLVPRLQKVCALDGIRFEDKNNLSQWADELSQSCTLCIAQHEIGYSLQQDMGRVRDEDQHSGGGTRSTFMHIVTTKTCNEMQNSLKSICMTLTATIPYVGIMKGGIERRASVFFHRQKLLDPSADRASRKPALDF